MGLDFFEVIDRRFSVRSFQSTAVEDATLQTISGSGQQRTIGRQLAGFRGRRHSRRREEAAIGKGGPRSIVHRPGVSGACVPRESRPEPRQIRVARSRTLLHAGRDDCLRLCQLAATASGLGACWVGAFHEDEVREIVGAPAAWRPVCDPADWRSDGSGWGTRAARPWRSGA